MNLLKQFIKKHFRKLMSLLIIFSGICTTYILFGKFPDSNSAIISPIEKLGISTQIVSFIFVIIASVIAVWQFCLSCKSEMLKNEVEKVQKAIELAEYYKNNILSNYTVIRYVYEYSGIINILNTIDRDKIKHFDEQELNKVLTKSKINELKSLQSSEKFIIAVCKANDIFNLNLSPSIFNSKDEKNKYTSTAQLLNKFMVNVSSNVLNNLELFSMYFTHNVADETVVYQSLHQTYILAVECLYYNIASQNSTGSSYYYTNVIKLYNIWKNRKDKQMSNIASSSRNNKNDGTIPNNFT